eukprot:TRINITY_DN21186_c0_g1_i1.p2 TRINITY_DN21186_c0_g1~~TRINITY_DN21186_c0_g1_i1.p2  ORF type:complete len:100 (-),score=13.81 TRINITY_DN21186_c0_g1_i1:61-360(-)
MAGPAAGLLSGVRRGPPGAVFARNKQIGSSEHPPIKHSKCIMDFALSRTPTTDCRKASIPMLLQPSTALNRTSIPGNSDFNGRPFRDSNLVSDMLLEDY